MTLGSTQIRFTQELRNGKYFKQLSPTQRTSTRFRCSYNSRTKEFVRLLEALQTTDAHGVATPENWTPGCKVIVSPPKTSQDLQKRLTEGYEMTDWYLAQKSI